MSHLWLIGMMGSGKTEVGRRVAGAIGSRFVDTDFRLVADVGRSIPEIFEGEGESSFRALEAATLRTVASEREAVVATGGGVVLSEENIVLIRSTGTVVYLAASATRLARRIEGDTGRPLIAAGDRVTVLAGILEDRRELYERACHEVVETDVLTLDQVAGEVMTRWKRS